MKKIIINFGCGKDIIKDAINIDKVKLPGVNKIFDFDKFPYPIKSDFADEIHCYFVLEHIEDHLSAMNEFFRILKTNGKLYIRVPHGSSCYGAWGEFTHKRGYNINSFDIFSDLSPRNYYSKARFLILKKKCKYFLTYPYDFYKYNSWFPHWENKWYSIFVKLYVNVIQFLIDLSPEIFERFWCYWVGGAAEVYVELEKK